ncbi:MAG: signal recognition particle protein [Chloroflexi bacterium]|nr:signal recognition particle protein [Chloroflexota bacterium]MCH2524031.1 signal recognition particle protein [Dehalococcoidia bacterium]|tara:strand:+ start:25840 stop:27174 length:1335 start_codon:yes stop_codon:yes gene_type:complete
MLDSLTVKFQNTFKRLGATGKITESDLETALKDVRVALLDADVNFQVVREFISDVREQALGQEITQSITPGQQIIAIVNQALIEMLGGKSEKLFSPKNNPTKIMVVGTKGAGKTTLCGRLALRYKKEGARPLLVSTDFDRIAAGEQLQIIGEQIEVPVWVEEKQTSSSKIAIRALEEAQRINANVLIIDTQGTLSLDDDLADDLAALADTFDPSEILITVDAMTGQDSVTLAKQFDEEIEGTGIVVTKVDSDTRGGAILSVRKVTGLPIKLITTGEKLDALEDFHPDRIASRILGMGDVVTLVEKAQALSSENDIKNTVTKMKTGDFNLEDFLQQMQQMKNMGPLTGILDLIPGGKQLAQQVAGVEVDNKFMARSEAIVLSMTLEERRNPDILNGSRRRRIAQGSGTSPAEVNRLLNQFKDAKKMMQALTTGKGQGGLSRILGL